MGHGPAFPSEDVGMARRISRIMSTAVPPPDDAEPRPSPETESTDGAPNGDPPSDESPHEKLYVAVDGISREDITDDEAEFLKKKVVNTMILGLGKPITGVRVIKDDAGVVEFDLK